MKEKGRLLFVTNYFYPETFRGNDIAFYLAEQGYEVTVLTNTPNYPQGRFFDGYGILKRRKEIVNGVKVVRVPIIPRGDGGKLRLVLNYVSGVAFLSCYALYLSFGHRFDKVFVQQLSPVFIAIPAIIIKKIQRIPLYYWLLDLWPESLSAGGIKSPAVTKMIDKLCRWIYRNCDKVLISSKGFRKILSGRGVIDAKIEYFPNWSEDTISQSEVKPIPQLPEGFKIMFAGNIGEAQNFDNVLQAALRLKSNSAVKWIIIGDGRKSKDVAEFVEKHSLQDSIFLMGRYDISYMSSFFKEADIMLVSLKDDFAFNSTLPAKVQAYMSCRKPVLGMLNGEGNDIIHEAKCGFCVGADDVDGLVETVNRICKMNKRELDELGENGFDYYKRYFDKAKCMSHLTDILTE
jgi:glycosyltransferase involved in cell wall biosynthesis